MQHPPPRPANRIRTTALAIGALLLCGAPGARAQVAQDPDSALAATLAAIAGDPLTLDEALQLAAENATAVRTAEADLQAARGQLRRENGAFDPVLFADLEVRENDAPTASPFAGADVLETRERFSRVGARLTLPSGAELEATAGTTRLETNSAFAALDPQYTTDGRLRVRQPLLKGFGPGATGSRSSARRGLDAARARRGDAERRVETDVTAAYWDLYASEQDLAVQRLLAQQGEALLEEATRRAEVGLVGPSEVATATVFRTEQQLAALDGEERLDEVSDRLAILLGRGASGRPGRFRTVTGPPETVAPEAEGELVERALRRNGELEAARADLEARRAEARAARWNAFPALDLVGSVGGNGLTGVGQPVIFGTDTTIADAGMGFGESVREALARDFPTWSVGVSLELPVPLRAGRGERDRLRGEVARAEARVAEVERQLRADVRARHRELRHGAARLELGREGVEASLEQVRIGQIEYENGRTTAFQLVRLAADLAAAQERYSDALVRTAKAAAELGRLAPREETP